MLRNEFRRQLIKRVDYVLRQLSLQSLYILVALVVPPLIGCGDGLPERVSIAGKVLIDGQPLEQGFIQVIPSNERAASAEIGPGGSFRLTTYKQFDGCVLGTHKVAVIANESQGPTAMKWFAPKKYADAVTSGLTLEVTEARDDIEFELTWDGGSPFVETFADEGSQPPPE